MSQPPSFSPLGPPKRDHALAVDRVGDAHGGRGHGAGRAGFALRGHALADLDDVAVVAASVVILVFASTVTVRLVVAELSVPKSRAAIITVDPDTDVTFPAATAPMADRPDGNPDGTWPDGNPDGNWPDGNPDGRCPFPGPRKPPKQVPLAAEATVSVVAVNEAAVADVPDGATAVTHSPARTEPSVVATAWLNFVDAVQETATWPDCGFCTCIVLPDIAATVPEAAGPPRRGAPVRRCRVR